jgi:hypothetical protein
VKGAWGGRSVTAVIRMKAVRISDYAKNKRRGGRGGRERRERMSIAGW